MSPIQPFQILITIFVVLATFFYMIGYEIFRSKRRSIQVGWIFNGTCRSKNRLDGKTIVITGCNTGIGKETARECFKRGGRVLMACRDLDKAKAAVVDIVESMKGIENVGQLAIKELNLLSFTSIRKCANEINKEESKIHILINNAGLMSYSKELSEDGYESKFATNHLGHFLFTLLILPKIIQSAPARIVNASSHLHYIVRSMHLDDINLDKNYSAVFAYSRSKAANILFAAELGRRLKGTGVTTYSLHPGVVCTEFGRHFNQFIPGGRWIFHNIGKYFLKTPVQGAQTSLYCALDEKCDNESSLYYTECEKHIPSRFVRDRNTAKRLWEESWKLVKLDSNYDPFVAKKGF